VMDEKAQDGRGGRHDSRYCRGNSGERGHP
jgi:hypothetical protein